VRSSQLTESNRVYGRDHQEKGRKPIGWAQAILPLQARLQEPWLKDANPHSWRKGNTPEDKLTDLRNGEQSFMAIRLKLIGAGCTTLDSIPRIQKASGKRFYCPPLKGVDKRTQEILTDWISELHKFPAHLHALDIKEVQAQRYPGVKQLSGIKTTQLADKHIVKRKRIRNQCALLKNIGEEGIQHYLDKPDEIIRACDKLKLTWTKHGSPLGDPKVKETMFQTISKTADELEQWIENSSAEDILTFLTQIETSLDKITEMDAALLQDEEEADPKFPPYSNY